MSVEPITRETQRVRAPRSHGSALVVPSPLHIEELLRANAVAFEAAGECRIADSPLQEVRLVARQDVILLAHEFTAAYRDVPPRPDISAPLILSGHQPALYHPGVWFKNFLADRLAATVSGMAINVIVDNDIAPVPSIAALGGTRENPQPARVAYDVPGPRLPWEMTQVQSLDTLQSFPARLRATIAGFAVEPSVDQFWPDIIRGVQAGKPLGLAISAARSRREGECGLGVLDVPLSTLSQTAWFLQFVVAILAEAPRFREIYNASVREYRRAHKIRSQAHPVPDLEQEDDWTEVPFWIWTARNRARRPLWIRQVGQQWQLSDRQGWLETISEEEAVPQLQALAAENVYLRSRALTTTTILRLAASDVFIHGIGGAQYDQVTDVIIRRFFHIDPPRFITATATLHLPITPPQVQLGDLRNLDRQLRDARFNPQRLPLEACSAREEELLAEHARLIENVPDFPAKRAWHTKLQQVNAQLRALRADRIVELKCERDLVVQELQQAALVGSREYSLVLHPLDGMRQWLVDLAEQAT